MEMLKRVTLTAGLTMLGVAIGVSASAASWGPNKVYESGDLKGQGKGSSIGQNQGNSTVGGHHQTYDNNPGGSGIYNQVKYLRYGPYCSSGSVNCWDEVNQSDQSPDNYTATWKDWTDYGSYGSYSDADKFRLQVRPGMDKTGLPDPTGAWATFTYTL